MVKKVIKFLSYCLFFALALIAFSPKSSFYFLFEKELKKFDVVISKESLHETFLSLEVEHLDISAKKIESATVGSAEITLLLLYNSITLQDISLSSLVESYLPSKIEHFTVGYSLLNPLNITAEAEGDFGEASVVFEIDSRVLRVSLKPSKTMQKKYYKSMKLFTKDKNGEYSYAKNF